MAEVRMQLLQQQIEAMVAEARQLQRDIVEFEHRWAAAPVGGEPFPAVTWRELERQLVDLAPTDTQAEMTRRLVERVRRHAERKPPEMVLREVLGLAAFLLDETLYTGLREPG